MYYEQYEQYGYGMAPQMQLAPPPASYCMECGALLQPGLAYCMECGTRVGTASDKPANGGNAAASSAAPYPGAPYAGPYPYPMQNGSGSGGVLLIGVLLLVAAIILLTGVILFTQSGGNNSAVPFDFGSDDSQEFVSEDEGYSDDDAPVRLISSYMTDSQEARPEAYPVFKFRYADGWEIGEDENDARFSGVTLNATDLYGIVYMMVDDSNLQPYTVRVKNMEKIADCALDFKDGSSSSASQKYAVAKFDIQKSDSAILPEDYSVITVLPEDVINNPSKIDFSTGAPSFKHGYNISFFMTYYEDFVIERRLEEAKETLASLEFVKEVPASDMSELNGDWDDYLNNGLDYIIPYSSSILLTEDDLSGLSAYELYLARNEIYARHGRKFLNDDLNAYFNSKDWYYPIFEPEEFSDSMLSQVERDNLQTILAQERSMASPYID